MTRIHKLGAILLLAGCVGEPAVAPAVLPPDQTIGMVAASPINAIMAVGDTLPVTVTGQTLTGLPITTFDSVWYTLQSVTDTIRVRVAPTGVITARVPSGNGTPVVLNVIPFKGGLAKGDQTIIQVTASPVSGATLSIHPIPPDSARIAQRTSKTIVPVVRNPATGQGVPSPTFRLTINPNDTPNLNVYGPVPQTPSLNANQVVQNLCDICVSFNGMFATGRSGTVWVHANVVVYGTPLQDSVQYIVTSPFAQTVTMTRVNLGTRANNPVTYIAPGGTVTFQNSFNVALNTTMNYTFDNPSVALVATPAATAGGTSGNVVGLTGGQSSTRKFVTPGTYNFTATVAGSVPPYTGATMAGQVVVQ